jgi:hypothetical protein
VIELTTCPLPPPAAATGVAPEVVVNGQPIPPIERIRLFSAEQWEQFILEWVDSLRQDYERVERCGGAGDMGRDIIAVCRGGNGIWDNYQCKHYRDPLSPSKMWIELGKLVYYSYKKAYTYPRWYYFVAPQGGGTKLSNLLRDPERLRSDLLTNWDTHCRSLITSACTVDLDDVLRSHIESLDFSIFEAIPPLHIIDQHAKTRWYVARFGGGLPQRPPIEEPPTNPTPAEARYVHHLLDAYSDYLHREVSAPADIKEDRALGGHFKDSREAFYSAESLRAFSRDTLPPGEFDRLQSEVHDGIIDELRADHPDGYRRVLAVVKTAKLLPITAHPLVSRCSIRDKGGICHQLANDDRVKWVK